MEKLKKLVELCKCGVSLEINAHRNEYMTVEQYFKDLKYEAYMEDIDPEIYQKMKELDTIVELFFYPNTPIGYYSLFHYDLEKVIDQALLLLTK